MKVIIIGAGIGGLSTAIALQQRNIEYEVYEAVPEIREVGAGIWVPPNAMNVFERLGIAGEIKKAGKLIGEICVGDQDGNVWQRISSLELLSKYGNGTTAIHRGKLQAILYDQLDKEKVFVNKKFVRFSEESGKVKVYFQDNTFAEGDMLIGADGVRSTVRQQLFGEPQYRYSGQTCWRTITDFNLPSEIATHMYEFWGKGLRFAYSQVTDSQVYFYATCVAPQGGKDNPETLKGELKRIYAPFGSLALKLIESASASHIIRTDLGDIKPIPQWIKGKVALIGDAAHATTPNLGQGGAQAIEDAYVIVKCIAEKTTIEEGLKTYQSIRFKKANFIVNTSWSYGKMSNVKNSSLVTFRNFIFKSIPKSIGKPQFDKIYKLNY